MVPMAGGGCTMAKIQATVTDTTNCAKASQDEVAQLVALLARLPERLRRALLQRRRGGARSEFGWHIGVRASRRLLLGILLPSSFAHVTQLNPAVQLHLARPQFWPRRSRAPSNQRTSPSASGPSARTSPPTLRTSAAYAHLQRWTSLLAVAAQDALACTLLHGHAKHTELWNGGEPPLGVVLGERTLETSPDWSRLPLLQEREA